MPPIAWIKRADIESAPTVSNRLCTNCRGHRSQKNCPEYSRDSENGIIIGEAIASPQLFLYKRKIFVYNRKSCNADIIEMFL